MVRERAGKSRAVAAGQKREGVGKGGKVEAKELLTEAKGVKGFLEASGDGSGDRGLAKREQAICVESPSDKETLKTSLRKMSSSSMANSFQEGIAGLNLRAHKKRESRTETANYQENQDKSTNPLIIESQKNNEKSLIEDKAAHPDIKWSIPSLVKKPSLNILEIWEDTDLNLFSLDEQFDEKNLFEFENFNSESTISEYEKDQGLSCQIDNSESGKTEIINPEIKEVESNTECFLNVCLNENCKNKLCIHHWSCNKKVEGKKVEKIDQELLDEDLGKGRSMELVSNLVDASKEIFANYSNLVFDEETEKIKKSKKKREKLSKKKKEKKKPKKVKNIAPILQEYKKEWEKAFSFGRHYHYRNRLILNPLIFQGIHYKKQKDSFKSRNKRIPFPSTSLSSTPNNQAPKYLPETKPQNINTQTSESFQKRDTENNLRSIIGARPRYAWQHRRKSSLLNQEETEHVDDNPIKLCLCSEFHKNGVCKNGASCLGFHDFKASNRYGHLMSRFRNALLKELFVQGEGRGVQRVLNLFHSLHPALPVFRDILFRKPETCIFDLIT